MIHPIYRVCSFDIIAPYTLRIQFDENTEQIIDFWPILAGELYKPLRDLTLFYQVRIDPEAHTLIWPNGADFDPATLHDWPRYVDALTERAQRWERALA
ncbi:MAG: DUF2442 domain-containing protein [Acidobacteria bacterium]|nr:DUF2442 domain-containing protein [Acidobacteriota bacterium]MBI3655647.1 DUF2442 domain-containing protein [Acidobacteriota bacterium]